MGDEADYDIEQGEDEYFLHLAGKCGQFEICPYCEAEIEQNGADDATRP